MLRVARWGAAGPRHRRGLAFKSSVPNPTKEERLAFLREMSSKQPEPEPEPPWRRLAMGSPTGSVPARHQADIADRRLRWAARGTRSLDSDERICAALTALFDERSTIPARVNIRRKLELLSRDHASIPYNEFLLMCRDCGLPTEAEAHALAADLTVSGVAVHFPGERYGADIASVMFLRPVRILDELDAATGRAASDHLDRSDAEHPRAMIERVRARRAAVAHNLAPLTAQILNWDSEATKAANRRLLVGLSGYCSLQITFLLYTFDLVDEDAGWPEIEDVLEPGWDVMEPLTYTVGSGLGWLMFGWFALTNSPLGYQAFRARHVDRVTARLRKQNTFPSELHQKLVTDIRVFDKWLAEHETFEAERWDSMEEQLDSMWVEDEQKPRPP